MRRRRVHFHQKPASYYLQLTSMVDMLTILLIYLLQSYSSDAIHMLETDLPAAVQAHIEQNENQKQSVTVSLKIRDDHSMTVSIKDPASAQAVERTIASQDNQFDVNNLNIFLVGIKNQYPHIFSLELITEENVTYDSMIRVMDYVRKPMKDQNMKFNVKNPKTGETEQTDLMFPDVIFGNVLEG